MKYRIVVIGVQCTQYTMYTMYTVYNVHHIGYDYVVWKFDNNPHTLVHLYIENRYIYL